MSESPDPTLGSDEPDTPEGSSGCLKGCLWLVAGVVLFGIVLGISVGSGGDSKGGPTLAKVVCERSVKEKLKDPSSAQFSDATAVTTGTDQYEVTGTVRAKNSFGGVVVHAYTCIATEEDSDSMLVKSTID